MLWGSWHLFAGIERSFSGRTEERQVTVHVDTPRNYSLDQTRELFDELRGILMSHKDKLDIVDNFFQLSGWRRPFPRWLPRRQPLRALFEGRVREPSDHHPGAG